MNACYIKTVRELCDKLDNLIEIAKQGRTPVPVVCLVERARADLQSYLDEIERKVVNPGRRPRSG